MARRARSAKGELLEDPFRETVEQLAGFYGWLSYHTHDSRRSQPGFPDDVLVRGAELLFVEFKTDRGRVRPEQQVWLDALETVGCCVAASVAVGHLTERTLKAAVEVHLWRPSMFDDVIHPRLARGRVRHEPIDSPVPPPAAPTRPRRTQ